MSGFSTLLRKEVLRFWKVSVQTVVAPVLTAMLYLLVFSQALSEHFEVVPGVSYVAFLTPGLVMMSVLQNAFANTSSSLIQSKVTGNLVFVLLPPLASWEIFGAYVLAAMMRGLLVGVGVWAVAAFWVPPHGMAPFWIVAFAVLGSAILGTIGLIGGLWAEKFDQVALLQHFFMMPATFLAGVFYSVDALPPFWRAVSYWNPIFYMVDGFRFGFIGHSDVAPQISLAVVFLTFVVVSILALRCVQTGWRIRH
jgi:ABC-2 type transport system permease protein